MGQKREKKKKNYTVSCISSEFVFFWTLYFVAALFIFGFLIWYSFSSNGTVLGLSNIKTTAQLEKFFTETDKSGRLCADSVLSTGLQVDLTESSNKGLGVQIGGAYVETPSFTVSTYDKTYDIYFAPLEKNLLIVLSGDIFAKGKLGLDTYKSIFISSTPIGGAHLLIDELKEQIPQFFSLYEHVYVVKGGRPVSIVKPSIIILSVFILLAAVLFLLPRLSPLQRLSRFGRQISAAAKAEGRTFKEMCKRLDEYSEHAYYRNGNQILSGRYIILKDTAGVFMNMGEQMKLYFTSDRYGEPFIRNITMNKSDYPDEMNDIILTASNGKSHRLTIHQPMEDVAGILGQLGF